MTEQPQTTSPSLASKIARLVQERGWNKEDFARIAQLNRQTVFTIMSGSPRKLRNSTVSACARALGVSVNELRTLPLERLLARMNGQLGLGADEVLRRLYEKAAQPDLIAWIERNPERARQLTTEEIDELLALQGQGGPLMALGVERVVEMLERKRRLLRQVHAIAGTEYMDLLEKLVTLLYEKIQPYPELG